MPRPLARMSRPSSGCPRLLLTGLTILDSPGQEDATAQAAHKAVTVRSKPGAYLGQRRGSLVSVRLCTRQGGLCVLERPLVCPGGQICGFLQERSVRVILSQRLGHPDAP